MWIKMKSPLSNNTTGMEIPVDPRKLRDWRCGKIKGFIQDVFPELNADQREFLLTGITPEEWENAFGEEE